MKATVEKQILITLVVDEKEAEFIKDITCHKYNDESEEQSRIRINIYNTLSLALRESNL